MATSPEIIEYIVSQLRSAGNVFAKKMFGEYGLYLDDKMIALVCDNQLFVKPTQAGKDYLKEVTEGQPYPGAKAWYLVTEDNWDDADWLCGLVLATAPEVTPVKKKEKKR